MRRTIDEWVEEARGALLQCLASEHALIHPAELTARLSERYFQSDGTHVNYHPHVVGLAAQELIARGDVVHDQAGSTPNRHVATISLAQPAPGAQGVINRAKARKRRLFNRYLTWASGAGPGRPGTFGPAGEQATREALGPRITEIDRRNVLGVTLTGALDVAGFMVPIDKQGMPGTAVTVMVEVKNVRNFIYPEYEEVWQLMNKSIAVSVARPTHPVLPILVCRRAHESTIWMAKQLGFMVVETKAQFAGPVDQGELDEVRNELHFTDLKAGHAANKYMTKQLYETAPRIAPTYSSTWAQTLADPFVLGHLQQAAQRRLPLSQRKALLAKIETHLGRTPGNRGWMLHR